jgi:hypothetical protein
MTPRLIQLTILTVLVSSFEIIVCAQSSNSDSLKPYTSCKVTGDLKIKEVTRRTAGDSHREVITDKGKEKVSVIDGYRVMFAFPDLIYYFANVKIEQSAADSYEQDKQILINHLKHFTTIKEATAIVFTDKMLLNGFEDYGIDRDKIDVGGQVGTHVLFDHQNHLVVTIYFLNQSKAVIGNNRRFETIKQYRELRDDFLNSYSQCLRRVADTH